MKTLLTWLVAAVVMVWLVIHETGMFEDRYGPEQSPGQRILAAELPSAARGELVPIRSVELPDHMWAAGHLTANHEVHVAPEVGGLIQEMQLEIGQLVQKGEVIARLDATAYLLAIAQAEAAIAVSELQRKNAQAAKAVAESGAAAARVELDFSEIESERQKALFAKKATTDLALTGAKARLAAAHVGVQTAKANVAMAAAAAQTAVGAIEPANQVLASAQLAHSKTTVLAPITGVVTARMQERGGLASPGMPLVKLRAPEDLRLTAWFPESNAVVVGDDVMWRLPARNATGRGKVVELGAQVDPLTRTRAVHVAIDFEKDVKLPGLAPGLYAEAWMQSGSHQALLVPRAAVKRRGQVMSVRIQRGDKIVSQHVRAVEIDHEITDLNAMGDGLDLTGWLIVLSGLRADDVVEVVEVVEVVGGSK